MQDYYIRTPEHEESRGPFDAPKLQTLAEAGQINENTLYYDEGKEEWIPIALNKELKAQVFPDRKKLELKIGTDGAPVSEKEEGEPKAEPIRVEDMLAAAEGDTEETRHLKKKERSFQKAAAIACSGIGLMMLFSAIALLMPHFTMVDAAIREEAYITILNYPFVLVGLFDFVMAVFLFLAITEIYPALRARAGLTLGFGLYVGWALSDPTLMLASAAGAVGIFYATLSRSYISMLLALAAGIAGNGYLAYFSLTGRFTGFFDAIKLGIFSVE